MYVHTYKRRHYVSQGNNESEYRYLKTALMETNDFYFCSLNP